VEVLSGLSPGDRVVIDGADKLRDGAKIVLRQAADASNPHAAPAQGQNNPDAGNNQNNPGAGKGQNNPGGGKRRGSNGGPKQ
jgi:multidrug efflux system membrane fusion protein